MYFACAKCDAAAFAAVMSAAPDDVALRAVMSAAPNDVALRAVMYSLRENDVALTANDVRFASDVCTFGAN